MSKHPKQRAVDGNTKQVENEESKYLSNLKPFKFKTIQIFLQMAQYKNSRKRQKKKGMSDCKAKYTRDETFVET